MDLGSVSTFYSGKKVLITGATGVKGAWLAAVLSEFGATVSNISLNDAEPRSAFINLGLNKKICNKFLDICDKKSLELEIVKIKPDFIYHFAAEALVINSYLNPEKTFQTNLMGTLNLYEAVKKLDKDCVVIKATTDKVYVNQNLGIAFSEEHSLGYSDPYSTSKSMVEMLSGCYYHSFSIVRKIFVWRQSAGNIIGPGDWSINRLLPDIARAIFDQDELVLRNPKSTRPWQLVTEAIKGYLLLGYHLSKSTPTFVSYNFGPEKGDAITTIEIVQLALKKFSFPYQVNQTQEFMEQKFLELNSEKARNDLGFTPIYSVEERVHITLDGYEEIIIKNSLMQTLKKVLANLL